MPLSGKEMLKIYLRVGKNGERETIPMHRELKKGLEFKLLKRLRLKQG